MNKLNPQIGIFITRVSLGLVIIAHSIYLKLFVYTLPGTAQFFESIGLPAVMAYVVFAAEALSGTAMLLGYRTRLAATVNIPILLGATWVHWSNGWLFTNSGGGWEYPLFLAINATALVFLGDGAFALRSTHEQRSSGMRRERSIPEGALSHD